MFLRTLFLKKKRPSLLGIDVGASSIKLVELEQAKLGGFELTYCAREPLERDIIVNGNIQKFDELVNKIKLLIKKSGSKTHNVAFSIPSSAVITKTVSLPVDLSEREMEEYVEMQASQYIPFQMDEVSLDFCVLGPSAHSDTGQNVLIVASRKDKIQDLQGLAEAAGLSLELIDVTSYAQRRAFARCINIENDSVVLNALIEIGGSAMNLQVLQGEKVLYEREQPFGGNQLTDAIARHYALSIEEAEKRKISGDLPPDYEDQVLKPFLDNLLQELSRALQFFYSSTAHTRVDHVYVAGGSASLSGLAKLITKQTGVACSTIDPFVDMGVNSQILSEKLLSHAPSFLSACGLALRRFSS